tara:strand:+ start:165 stop:374 length:210 start_codon:yes stop_codon:yes gene_type:complete
MSKYNYNIVRFYKDAPSGIRRRVIEYGVTLDQAKEHCGDPQTSSRTATKSSARRRTKIIGEWFDGYEEG